MKKWLSVLTIACLVFVLRGTSVSAATPPGLAKKGGLPPGIQKRFIEEKKEKKYSTVVKDINLEERRITIEDGTAILNLLVSDKAKIELNKKSAKLEEIMKNDKIFIKLDKKNTITELRATRGEETVHNIEGTITKIDYNNLEFELQEGTKITLYKVKSSTPIKIDGETKTFKDLVVGMKIKASATDKNILSIEAKSLQKNI
ncbi:hypothetical protein KQI86_09220 [Clostridium sp. MSJ-11]|uniref:DUF5666 domain-containing protein n=1 Tax=Clostridium mobile TaxID=2841512 RepID=A0ABS6EJC8_9CLOT|nr:hypothetical protein [Clostridium mobile]MBU5484509.1 hypothetical protein [Clostridium mobile]